MEKARIIAHSERAKEALHRFNKKKGQPISHKIAYFTVIKEKFISPNELQITVRNKHIAALMKKEDFIQAAQQDFSNIPQDEWEVIVQ